MSLRLSKVQCERLDRIHQAAGTLTPNAVIDDAKQKNSPLHKLFDWNDKTAGGKYRLARAREIIATVPYEILINNYPVRSVAYVRDPMMPSDQQGYSSVEQLRRDPHQARLALINELRVVSSYLKRAQALAVALGLSDEIDQMLLTVAQLRQTAEADVATH